MLAPESGVSRGHRVLVGVPTSFLEVALISRGDNLSILGSCNRRTRFTLKISVLSKWRERIESTVGFATKVEAFGTF